MISLDVSNQNFKKICFRFHIFHGCFWHLSRINTFNEWINFCSCNFVLILFKDYGNLLKDILEHFNATSAPMKSELCIYVRVCAMQLTTHVRLVFIWDMNSWMYSFSQYQLHKSFTKKDAKPKRTRGRMFHPFSILPLDSESVFARCFKRIETSRYRRIPKESSMHIRRRRTQATRMFVAKYGREISFPRRGRINIFPAEWSPRYRSSLSAGLEIISASSLKWHKIFLSEETFPSFTVLWQICMRLYVST